MKIILSRRNSPYKDRQMIEVEGVLHKHNISMKDYERLSLILLSLRESGDLEISMDLPDRCVLRNRKYYISISGVSVRDIEEIWKVLATREKELSDMFLLLLLSFPSFRWGRIEANESKVSSEEEVSEVA